LAKQVFDRVTSPKLGGVRFVDKTQKVKAAAIGADPRTPGQLASDARVSDRLCKGCRFLTKG
jgi:hypothetical protein